MLTAIKMFQLVESVELNEIFEEKWKKICKENEFIYISKPFELLKKENISRYLVVNADGEYIGTIEFVGFNPGGYSIINNYYDFHNRADLAAQKEYLYEVGKLSIDLEKRNEGHLEKILLTMAMFSKENDAKRYLFAIEGKLFEKLEKFGLKIKQVADTIINKKNTLVPGEFDVETLFEDIENNRWLKRKFRRM